MATLNFIGACSRKEYKIFVDPKSTNYNKTEVVRELSCLDGELSKVVDWLCLADRFHFWLCETTYDKLGIKKRKNANFFLE